MKTKEMVDLWYQKVDGGRVNFWCLGDPLVDVAESVDDMIEHLDRTISDWREIIRLRVFPSEMVFDDAMAAF